MHSLYCKHFLFSIFKPTPSTAQKSTNYKSHIDQPNDSSAAYWIWQKSETTVLHDCAPPDDGPVRAETCTRWHIKTILWF